jgi:hypothetical protein
MKGIQDSFQKLRIEKYDQIRKPRKQMHLSFRKMQKDMFAEYCGLLGHDAMFPVSFSGAWKQ